MDTYTEHASVARAQLGGACNAAPPEPQRTLDGVAEAVSRVRKARRALDRMNDRFSPTPQTESGGGQMVSVPLGRLPYASSLERLFVELSELDSAIDILGKHA